MRSWTSPEIPSLPRPAASPGATAGGGTTEALAAAWTPAQIAVRDVGSGEVIEVGGDHARASLYVCGITPYDSTHLGHAATYLAFDLLVRAWTDAGYAVDYTQNVTDVDDPLLERASATGEDWRALADREIDRFRADMEALRVIPPTHYLGVVETMRDVVGGVERMLADGVAYRVGPDADGEGNGDVYADLSADRRFGRDTNDLDREANLRRFAEMGGDPDRPGKRDPLDPLLWRVAREGEPRWDGRDLGEGRPGWHVECATIAAMTLGAPLDVQGGGTDLRFPHHAMTASHVRMVSHVPRPVRVTANAGMVMLEGEKMSKSRGNLVLVSDLVARGEDPMAIRLAVLDHHYAWTWDFKESMLEIAQARLELWRAALARPAGPDASGVLAEVRAALADDLDSPRALATIDAWATAVVAPDDEDGAAAPLDPAAPGLVRDIADALLGVAL